MTYRLIHLRSVRARVNHRCIWCGERILPGEKYTREKSVFNGDFQDMAWHPECRTAAGTGWDAGDDVEFSPYDNERGTA